MTDIVKVKIGGINCILTLTSPRLRSPDYKVEIEITAYRGASRSNVREINLAT